MGTSVGPIEFLMAVAEERSVGAASQRLNVDRSVIIEELVSLETRIGHDVLVRTPAGLRLTEAGRQWLGEAIHSRSREGPVAAP